MSLINQLAKKGILTKEKAASLKEELKSSGKKEEEIILKEGIIKEDVLFQLKSESLKIPLKEVEPSEVPLEVLKLIPKDAAEYYYMIPLSKKDRALEIGMVYPENLKAQEALKFLTRRENYSFRVYLITLSSFRGLLKQYSTLKKEVKKALTEMETEIAGEKVEGPKRAAASEKLGEEAPISKIVSVILKHSVEGNASDIHIEPVKDKLRVRFRLDGILHSSLFLPLKIHPAVVARIKILSDLKIDETRIPQDGRIGSKINGRDIDFRVSTFPTILGEKVVMRVLDPSKGLKNFEKLGLEGRNLNVLIKASERPYGMILATGPTGSGKSTTLYAVLQLLNKEGVNIVTIEDPVEYFMAGLNQSQTKEEIGYGFAQSLRSILRQDPDIIMVGEIRDKETATLAVHAALTGHIVLSTLHTNTAVGAIPRLIDLGIEPFLLPSSLSAVLAQRLVRRLCPFCKQKVKAKPQIKEKILKEINSLPIAAQKKLRISDPLYIWEPKGCKKCRLQGYAGRIAVYEILEMTKELAELIIKAPSEVSFKKEAERQGMLTMAQDGISKVLKGVTSVEEVIRVSKEQE
ncbi:type II/IV secretion system protein [Candidatus Parcubacteria bacterium]|nr:type II/IV secretion system protein [Candidatus Parcubacteria bacterium]